MPVNDLRLDKNNASKFSYSCNCEKRSVSTPELIVTRDVRHISWPELDKNHEEGRKRTPVQNPHILCPVSALLSAYHVADVKSTFLNPCLEMHLSRDHLLHFTMFQKLDIMPSKGIFIVETLADIAVLMNP